MFLHVLKNCQYSITLMVTKQKKLLCWVTLCWGHFGVFMVHFRLCSSNIGEISNMFIWIFVQYLSFGKNSSHSIKSCLVVGLLVATFFLLKTVYLFFRRNNAKYIENGFVPLSFACCLNENDRLWYVEWVFCSWKTQKDSRERTAKW